LLYYTFRSQRRELSTQHPQSTQDWRYTNSSSCLDCLVPDATRSYYSSSPQDPSTPLVVYTRLPCNQGRIEKEYCLHDVGRFPSTAKPGVSYKRYW